MYFAFVLLGISVKIVNVFGINCDLNRYEKYYSSPGDVYVVGLFEAHRNENCSTPNPLVLQQMYNIAVTVNLLNSLNYIPGLTLGMSLYDTCSAKEIAQKSFISSLVDDDCNVPYNLGILGSKSMLEMISNFSKVADVPVFMLNFEADSDILLKIAVQLVKELEYSHIEIAVLPNVDLISKFSNLTASENICIKSSRTFSQYDGSCPGENLIIFAAVTYTELSQLLKLETDCFSIFIIAVLDNNIDLSSITEHLLLHEVYVIISSNMWTEFGIAVEDDFETVVSTIQENLHYSNVTMDFIRTASKVLSIVDLFKHKLQTECGNSSVTLCSNLTKFQKNDERFLDEGGVFSTPEILGIEKRNILHYLILKSRYNVIDNYAEVRIRENEIHVEFANPMLHVKSALCNWNSEDCKNCSNIAPHEDAKLSKFFNDISFSFKSNGWVSSVLTICAIGVISSCCVFAFVFGRVCKEDILEGNPCSTFLLIAATVLAYTAVLPFTVNSDLHDKTLCVMKLFGTSISYCFIFSVILSRALMILTCDYNGSFMSHINGYLQTFLCVFMFAVQFGLVLEFWIFGWVLSETDYCDQFMNNNFFLVYMVYDTFLLIIIAFVVPFVTRSKRNYKEGLCFTILSVCLVTVWLLWTFGYFIVTDEWKDFCVAVGLTATASAIVVCVFIPRTYLMATGIVRDRIHSAIPSNISNLIETNYRSTQALYDSVNLSKAKRGELNIGYYDDPLCSSSTSCLDIQVRNKSTDVTVHGDEENNYESCDGVDCEQKITKF